MLRHQRISPRWFQRCIYIPSVSTRQLIPRRPLTEVNSRLESRTLDKEAEILDEQLRDLKTKQRELREKFAQQDEKRAQEKLAASTDLKAEATDADLANLENHLKNWGKDQYTKPKQSLDPLDLIPLSIRQSYTLPHLAPNNGIQLFNNRSVSNSWSQILHNLPELIEDVSISDTERFISKIPLKQRAALVNELERIVPEGHRSQLVKDHFMACYAELARPHEVEKLMMQSENPTTYSFGHLAKSYFKSGAAPEILLGVSKSMQEQGLDPTLPIMSTIIQSHIQHGRHDEATKIFDNMKYWSVNTQPDLKLYNSMILSAAKQHNVNKCLDLLSEMQNRQQFPLHPNEETYNYLVYACARDPKTHLTAWNFFMESQSNGFQIDRQSFRALVYLCGSSGEVLLARALVRKLSENGSNLVHDYTLNSLLMAYANWKPGVSKILASPTGQSIRTNLLMDDSSEVCVSASQIPFLPTAQLSHEIVLAESASVFEYFAETNFSTLKACNPATRANAPAFHNILRVAINQAKSINEFKRRWNRFTKFSGEQSTQLLSSEDTTLQLFEATGRHPTAVIERDQHLYRMAILAATKFKDLDFGREIWTERGEWRKMPAFRKLSQETRNAIDFNFVTDLVNLLAVCGRVEEAAMLVQSAKKLKRWRRHHLQVLIEACERIEDHKTLAQVLKVLKPKVHEYCT